MVETSVEFDHNCFWVSIPRIINQVIELVKVVIDCLLALKVGSCLQDVDHSGLGVQSNIQGSMCQAQSDNWKQGKNQIIIGSEVKIK